jgi:hypothetical protein
MRKGLRIASDIWNQSRDQKVDLKDRKFSLPTKRIQCKHQFERFYLLLEDMLILNLKSSIQDIYSRPMKWF